MLNRLIDFHLKNRWFVLAGLAALIGFGLYAMLQIPIDAFPDLTNNQVIVTTECPAMAPTEVEALVTFPIETALMGLPRTEGIRSVSKLGLSMVTLIFEDGVDTYFARQIVNERLQEVRSRIPEGLEPQLGPVATAFGEIYQYTVEGEGFSSMELKTIHDWQIKNQLRTVAGINEVNTWGGETRQYHVEVDPLKLQRYGLTLRDIYERISENNSNFGGGFIRHGSEQYTVRGLGRTETVQDLEKIVVLARTGTPVLLRDVAVIRLGAMPRQGAVTRDGKGEAVSGMTIMLKGENGRNVNVRVKERLERIQLPEGVRINPFYDQSTVINASIKTVIKNLAEGAGLVVLVLLLFLGNIKAAVIVASVIPLSMLFGFIGMRYFGISANLMSLGAIDFGMIVDGAVVMMESAVLFLERKDGDLPLNPAERVRQAAYDVARPITFAVAIIISVYLPVLFLQGLEGRMFRPMAITVVSALAGSLLLALFMVPAITCFVFPHGLKPHESRWFDALRAGYVTLLRTLLRNKFVTVSAAALVVAVAVGSLAYIGTEFMPKLDEGSILIETRKLPGISLEESVAISTRVEQAVIGFPEVTGVVTKIGRPDLATEAMGIYQGDVYVLLKPYREWTRLQTKEELIEELAGALEQIPGVSYNFTQPMAMRLDEVVAGVKADLAVKIFGEDPKGMEHVGEEALKILQSVPGAADTQMEIVSGVAELRVRVDRDALARYGLNVADVRQVMDAVIGGITVSQMIEGQRRFDIVLRLPASYHQDLDTIRGLYIPAPGGERVRLGGVARVEVVRGPEVISREHGQRRIVVQANVRGRDLGSFVAEAQERFAAELTLPPGHSIDWGGQFENQERATKRLMLLLPATIVIIFGLLFAMFNSVRLALLVLTNVPFALVGGIGSLWLRGLNLNLSASVGFIALFGVAVLNGIVLVSAIAKLDTEGCDQEESVLRGAGLRLRPILMAAIVPALGFVPMALNTSTGAEVQRPLATVVIGGLVTSTILTLFVLPVLYRWFHAKPIEDRLGMGD